MRTDSDILDYWFEKRNLSEATREVYTKSMKHYCFSIGKSISELHDEADDEEERGVRLKKRLYSTYIIKFKKYLAETGKSEQTIRLYLTGVKAFYQANDIRPPEITVRKGEMTMEQNYGHLLTKKEIKKLADIANTRDRAIIYLMALSGMSQREVRDLTLKKFLESTVQALNININSINELFMYEKSINDVIIMLEITRTKVHYRYHTFIPPEAIRTILTYLNERIHSENEKIKIKGLEGPLFVKINGESMTMKTVTNVFIKLGQRAGFKHEFGAYRSWRSHGLRKYFISTIINSLGDHILADYLAGHKIDEMKRRYWFADPEDLKKKYLKALPFLSLEDVEVHSIQSPEFVKVESELNDTKKRLKRLEKYFEERERIDNLEKP
jgi:integrase